MCFHTWPIPLTVVRAEGYDGAGVDQSQAFAGGPQGREPSSNLELLTHLGCSTAGSLTRQMRRLKLDLRVQSSGVLIWYKIILYYTFSIPCSTLLSDSLERHTRHCRNWCRCYPSWSCSPACNRVGAETLSLHIDPC